MAGSGLEHIASVLSPAIRARGALLEHEHRSAHRLFNGFLEGVPELAVDLFGRSAVILDHARDGATDRDRAEVLECLLGELPWLECVLWKARRSDDPQARRGLLVHGDTPDSRVREHGVWYALDLRLHQDAGLYLDTRNVRAWILENLRDRTVLNLFAYTGSLGVAAAAGGAKRVVHVDRGRAFLEVARASYLLNGLEIRDQDFVARDFFPVTAALRRSGSRFGCVFLDPPFFSLTQKGRVDAAGDYRRLLDKARPLADHGGWIVAINNALYLSGAEYMRMLEEACADGFLEIAQTIPVPEDYTGYAHTRVRELPVDPRPFNHATKIAVLRVRRKDS